MELEKYGIYETICEVCSNIMEHNGKGKGSMWSTAFSSSAFWLLFIFGKNKKIKLFLKIKCSINTFGKAYWFCQAKPYKNWKFVCSGLLIWNISIIPKG